MSEAHIGKSTTLKSFLNIGGRVLLMCVGFKLNREVINGEPRVSGSQYTRKSYSRRKYFLWLTYPCFSCFYQQLSQKQPCKFHGLGIIPNNVSFQLKLQIFYSYLRCQNRFVSKFIQDTFVTDKFSFCTVVSLVQIFLFASYI